MNSAPCSTGCSQKSRAVWMRPPTRSCASTTTTSSPAATAAVTPAIPRRSRRRRAATTLRSALARMHAHASASGGVHERSAGCYRRRSMKIAGSNDPRDRRVVGHRRRARAAAGRGGRDRRHRRPARRAARGGARALPRARARVAACGPPTSATSSAAEQVALEAWDAFGHLDCLVNNAAIPKRTPLHAPHSGRRRARDGRRLPLARPNGHGGAAPHARARARVRSSTCRAWAAASASRTKRRTARRSSRCAVGARSMAIDLHEHRRRREARAPGPDRDRDLGPARQRPRALRRAVRPRRRLRGRASCGAIEGDGFEYYVPAEFPGGIGAQHEIVVGKTQDADAFLRPRRRDGQGLTRTRQVWLSPPGRPRPGCR